MDTPPDTHALRARFAEAGQGQVFAFWPQLNEAERRELAAQAAEIDLAEIDHLVATLVRGKSAAGVDLSDLEPAPYRPHPARGGDPAPWREAAARGAEALAEGRVAAFTVAGGQGTRLGYDGPKGSFPVTPVRGRPLFQVFAEKIRAAGDRHGRPIPWFIMTSHQNHAATVDCFTRQNFFGLARGDVFFFNQGRMPAVDFEGRILLETPASLALSPDGHGGSLRALVRSGAVAEMERRGIDTLSYFQVDNPLVRCLDPAFLGFHLASGAEMSSKTIPKAYPREKLGHFCRQRGATVVIEYSDMPPALTDALEPDGQLRYRAGSIAIHVLGREFVRRTGSGDPRYALPFHRADKKIKTVDAAGRPVAPSAPNGVKFEMFVFDAIPFARDPAIVETLRAEDFSPVKNAEGVDSPQTCRDDQLRQWTRWARAAGVDLPADDSGLPSFPFEISPRYADSPEALARRWADPAARPTLAPGICLE